MFLAASRDFTGLMSDTPTYVLLADFFSPYYTSADWFGFLVARYPFPPLYPIVLGLLGGGSHHVVWTHLLGALTTCLGAAAYAYWLSQQDWSRRLAVLHALVFALMPITVFSTITVVSEPLYILFSLLALIFIGNDRRPATRWYATAMVLGLAAVIRTVGVTGIAAFLIYWWLHTRGTRYRGAPFVALLPTLVWAGTKWHYGFEVGYVASVFNGSLIDTVLALVAQVPANVGALWQHGVENIDVLRSATVAWILPVPLTFAFLGFGLRLRDRRFDAIYFALYAGLVVLWPHRDHAGRFVLCLVPLLLFYMTYGAHFIGKRITDQYRVATIRAIPLLLTAALELPSSALIVYQIAAYDGSRYTDFVRTSVWFRQDSFAASKHMARILAQMFTAIRTVVRHVEPGACITSVYPYSVMLLTQRPSLFPDPVGTEQAEFEQTMAQCRYVLILNATNDTFGYPQQYYPYDRLGDAFEIITDFYYEGVTAEPVVAAILGHYVNYPEQR